MSRPASHWMPFYVADYLADTTRLNTLQHGAYMLLLMEMWRNGPIPFIISELAAITRTDEKSFGKKIWPSLKRYFLTNEDGALDQKRISFERKKAQDISDKRRAAVSQRRDRKGQKTATPAKDEQDSCSTHVATGAGDLNLTRARNSHNHNIPLSSLRSDDPPRSAQGALAGDGPGGDETSSPKARRGQRLPQDWQPTPELAGYASERNLDPQREAEDFRDYWHARAGAGGVKLDWAATFRSWCRRSADRHGSRSTATVPRPRQNVTPFPRPASPAEQNRRASIDRIRARQEARHAH